jgi:TerC family integral membrane protein
MYYVFDIASPVAPLVSRVAVTAGTVRIGPWSVGCQKMQDLWLWLAFVGLIVALVAVDLGVSRRRHAAMSVHTALVWSGFWIALSIGFGLVIWPLRGSQAAVQFFTGYLIEKSLSVDNLFVFFLIFSQLRVPAAQQHRVLTWGILGALLMRAVMIFAGFELIRHYHFVIYLFGGFLVLTGVRTLFKPSVATEKPVTDRLSIRILRRLVPFVPRYDGAHFFTRDNGRRVGTMLLLALLVVEITDAIFAVDSIPAIFAVTSDPFIVFSSNILAILGLRALFFALAGLLSRLRYLHFGLGAILVLIGAKMCLSDVISISPLSSLIVTVLILTVTILASWARRSPRQLVTQP